MDKPKPRGGYRPGSGRKKGPYRKIHFEVLSELAPAAKMIMQPLVDLLNAGKKFKVIECHPEENKG